MKLSTIQKLVLAAVAVSGSAFAQTKAPEPDYTLSYNAGLVTDYRYRGLSQSARDPALQGGVDYAHKNGFYAGAWGSTIKWIKDSSTVAPFTAKGPVEIDLYGGYKGAFNDSVSYDVGALQYWYAGNTYKDITGTNANTFELYGSVSVGIFTAKYSQSLTDLFGTPNSKGSGYLDLSLAFDMGNGWSVTPHLGSQKIKNTGTYNDYSLTLAKDMDGLVLSAALVGTDFKSKFGAPFTLPGSGTTDLGKSAIVLGIKKNF